MRKIHLFWIGPLILFIGVTLGVSITLVNDSKYPVVSCIKYLDNSMGSTSFEEYLNLKDYIQWKCANQYLNLSKEYKLEVN